MKETCSATKTDGTRCQSPFTDESGLCPAHQPDGQARMRERAKKGGQATAAKHASQFDADQLPDLETPADAATWLALVGRAVASGALSHHAGNSITRTIEAWLKTSDAISKEQAEALREAVADIKRIRSAS